MRMDPPLVVAIEMGYGHLRAAAPLAELLGAEVLQCDRPPLADADEQRLWAEARHLYEGRSRVRYFAPSMRVVRRLRAYGVPQERIRYTGFPLPHALLGGPRLPALKRDLAARLVRLDPAHAFRDQFQEALDTFLIPLPPP